MSTRAAQRYAKAVFEGAHDSDTEAVVYGNIKSIQDTLTGSSELRSVLESPQFKAEDKRKVLHAVFKDVSEITTSLLDILIDNGRANMLDKVAQAYINLHNEKEGIVIAKVTTALPLNEELEKKVLAKVKEITNSKNVILDRLIDEKIIGGFILRVGDLQYDASISNQLDKVHKEFSKRI